MRIFVIASPLLVALAVCATASLASGTSRPQGSLFGSSPLRLDDEFPRGPAADDLLEDEDEDDSDPSTIDEQDERDSRVEFERGRRRRTRVPPRSARGPDVEGLARDTSYLIGYQIVGFGILYVSPESFSNWSEEDKTHYDASRWLRNVTHPAFDTDEAYINYGLHPYFGSAYYLSARDRGVTRAGAAYYSFIASCMFEFGAEAVAEPASIQDLIVTPVVGSLLGMALEPVLRHIRAKGPRRTGGDALLACLIDPIGETNNTLDGVFGFRSRTGFAVQPHMRPASVRGSYTGFQLTRSW